MSDFPDAVAMGWVYDPDIGWMMYARLRFEDGSIERLVCCSGIVATL